MVVREPEILIYSRRLIKYRDGPLRPMEKTMSKERAEVLIAWTKMMIDAFERGEEKEEDMSEKIEGYVCTDLEYYDKLANDPDAYWNK